jgi:G:T-mismatch repair DNA endonuclease (very short patch repair protein)
MGFETPSEYSTYEQLFAILLSKIGVRWISQEWVLIKKDEKHKWYKLDFFIPKGFYYKMKAKEGVVFEVQGEFHEERKVIRKDERKKEDLENAGYHVYEIWYKEFKDMEALKKKVINILKKEKVI